MKRVNFTGEKIGPYYIRERIGQGGMADVYRAYQPSVKREVALKIIPLLATSEYDLFQQRFKQEAEMIASLEHPHILPIFEYGISADILYLAMRLLRGGTLRDQLNRNPTGMEPNRAADFFVQIASALGYAHRRGVIHRDLKPSNILLDEEDNAYLADFGLAKVLGGSAQLTTSGSIIGTPAYMSPEQLRGDPINHRADIYSLGVILYHMLVGRPPFEALTTFSLIYQHVEKAPPPPRELNPQISPEVETVVLCALQKKPDDRFGSADEMSSALQTALGRKATEPLPPIPDLPNPVVAQISTVISSAPAPHRVPESPSAVSPPPAELTMPSASTLLTAPRRTAVSWPRSRAWLALGIMAIAAVTVISLLFFRPGRDQRVESPTVITGRVGTLQDLVPTEDELEVARNRLEDSFIAYVACNQTSQFFAAQARRMSDVAASYGLGFRLYDSNSQASQEIVQIERARTDGAQALMVCVVDAGVVRDVLTSVDEANIPLTLYNIDEPPTYGGILIRVEDYEMGLIVGRYIGQVVAAERGGQANVVILDYPSLPSIVARADGLQDGLLEYAPQAQIVGRYRGGTSRYAEDSVRQLLSDGVTIDVILSINDDGSYGAIRALESARTDPSAVIIGSIDAEDVAREYVREGYFMRATLEVASEVPSGAINSLVKQLAGGTLPEIVQAPAGDLITADSFGD